MQVLIYAKKSPGIMPGPFTKIVCILDLPYINRLPAAYKIKSSK